MSLIREFCAENMELVPAAVSAGAARIELCDNLTVGGTSPSYGVIRVAVDYVRAHDADVMAMCRPRGGDFVYSEAEGAMMLDDVRCARGLGVTGAVFGCLREDADGRLVLDKELVGQLVDAAKGAGQGLTAGADPVCVTFHMAFDALDEGRQLETIDALAALGVERILTHGGAAGTPIEQNYEHLAKLIAYADGRLTILPGGGITWENAESVASALGVSEVHGTKIVRL